MTEKIKIGVWGIGRAGWNMHLAELDALSDRYEVVSCCEPLPERRAEFCARYPGASAFASEADFLADPTPEVIAVATRSPDHIHCAAAVLTAGKIVFLEKPIALNYAGALEIKALAERHPGKLFIRHNRRFEAAFNHLLDILASGILGDVYEIKLRRHRFQLRNDWQTIVADGGGQLNNWGPHLIDHALLLLNSPVADLWSDRKLVASLGDAEDHIKLILRGENGRVIDLEISDGVALPSNVYEVYGTRGTLVSRNESDFHLRYVNPEQVLPPHGAKHESPARNSGYGAEFKVDWIEKTIPVHPANGFAMNRVYENLYSAIRLGVPFPVTVDQAVEVVRITDWAKGLYATDVRNQPVARTTR